MTCETTSSGVLPSVIMFMESHRGSFVVARVTFVSLAYQTRTPNTQWDGSRLELCFGLLFDFLSFVHSAKFRH